MNALFSDTKKASRALAGVTDENRSLVLLSLADMIVRSKDVLLAANAEDLARMDESNPLYDRLQLTSKRLDDIASDMKKVASLPCPLGEVFDEKTLPNGLNIRKVRVPFGVIGVVYEARPNVTFDVFSLCFKTGNACILKGGKDADSTNRAAISIIKSVLRGNNVNDNVVNLLPATHESTAEMLGAVGYVDVVIPRGGRKLIDFVRDNAKVPCIETGAGVVNMYFDASGDAKMGRNLVLNAKTRRVSVCNALDCLIVNSSRLRDLAEIVEPLSLKNVTLYADKAAYSALADKYPVDLLKEATEESFGTEYMDYKMAVKTVDNLDEALEHIAKYGSGHSESIITDNFASAVRFQSEVDAACVYVNAPTSFTDGAQFGLGAEIGISTQKLGARGPMGLREITTYKWLIDGNGQTRP